MQKKNFNQKQQSKKIDNTLDMWQSFTKLWKLSFVIISVIKETKWIIPFFYRTGEDIIL